MQLNALNFGAIISTFTGCTPRQAAGTTFLDAFVSAYTCYSGRGAGASGSSPEFFGPRNSSANFKARAEVQQNMAGTMRGVANIRHQQADSLSISAESYRTQAINSPSFEQAENLLEAARVLDVVAATRGEQGDNYRKVAKEYDDKSKKNSFFAASAAAFQSPITRRDDNQSDNSRSYQWPTGE